MAESMIEFDGVCVAYGAQALVVRDVSARIAKGSFVALIGASGSGKTSLLKTINRLTEPSAGTVRFDGQDVRDYAAPDLRKKIGYVFQGLGLFPHMSVAENIGVTPELLGWPRPRIAARVAELLALVALPDEVGARMPAELSGGQRQRVAVARALAANPPAMLMDEPFGALDPVTRDTLMNAYRAIHDRLGLTTVMVTHDIQEALLSADRVLVMSNGRLIADGTPASFLGEAMDADVAALIETPRRQAERIHALAREQDDAAHE